MQAVATIFRVFVLSCCGGLACAQGSLSDLEATATKAQEQWFSLASTLDTRLSRMLPCNPAVTTAIEEVQRASTARLAALVDYSKAVAAQASRDVAEARQLQRSQSDALANLKAELADTEQERQGIESQVNALAESIRRRVSLTVAIDELKALEASVRDRAALAVANVAATDGVQPRFDALAQVLVQRETALAKQVAALENERVKWNGYYSARLGRAMVECTETGR